MLNHLVWFLQYWSSVTPLNFIETKKISETNVSILFASYNHGDGFPFDGPGGMLAHTFYPTDGRTHYDNSEQWSSHSTTGGSSIFNKGVNPYYNTFIADRKTNYRREELTKQVRVKIPAGSRSSTS